MNDALDKFLDEFAGGVTEKALVKKLDQESARRGLDLSKVSYRQTGATLLQPAPVVSTPLKSEIMPNAPVAFGAREQYGNSFGTFGGSRYQIRNKSRGSKSNQGSFKVVRGKGRAKSPGKVSSPGANATKNQTKKKRPYPTWLKKYQFKKGGKK